MRHLRCHGIEVSRHSWLRCRRRSQGCRGQALGYVSYKPQKRHHSLYLMGLFSESEADLRFREGYAARGPWLDMGKSCLRFRRMDDLELGLIGEAIAALPVDRFLAIYERDRARR